MASDNDLAGWLRYQIRLRLVTARCAMGDEAPISGAWSYDEQGRPVPCIQGTSWQSSVPDGVWNCEDPDDICADLRRLSHDAGVHIAANDPRDTIARCEAELASLDLYERTAVIAKAPPERWAGGRPGPVPPGMVSAQDYLDAQRELAVLVYVVRQIGHGYRHWPGWQEAWGP